jgi:hypothetical protein
MERRKACDFPQQLLDLFDGYVHGMISRRQFLDGAQRFAIGGVTAAALFQMLKPNYAWAIQVPPDDKRIKTEYDTVPSPQGNGSDVVARIGCGCRPGLDRCRLEPRKQPETPRCHSNTTPNTVIISRNRAIGSRTGRNMTRPCDGVAV